MKKLLIIIAFTTAIFACKEESKAGKLKEKMKTETKEISHGVKKVGEDIKKEVKDANQKLEKKFDGH